MIVLALPQQRQFSIEFYQQLRATGALTLGLLWVETQHITLAPLAITDPHLFDLQIIADRLVAARSCQDLIFDSAYPAHRHRPDVTTQSATELSQVVGRVHPGIADKQAASEPPGAQ